VADGEAGRGMDTGSSFHLQIGAARDLFHQEDAAPGATYWHAAGAAIRSALLEHIRRWWQGNAYLEVASPLLSLLGGRHNGVDLARTCDECLLAPMGDARLVVTRRPCHFHRQLFEHRTRSLQLLPLRYVEVASCHERTSLADLCGLLRQREYCADIGHVYCTVAQVDAEVERFHEQCLAYLRALDLRDLKTRCVWAAPPFAGLKRCAAQERFERVLRSLPADETVGPSRDLACHMDYVAYDRGGTPWRLGCLKLNCVQAPPGLAVLHRSIIGSVERCIALLIERHGDALPPWLAPIQVSVVAADAMAGQRAHEAAAHLRAIGLRARMDDAGMAAGVRQGDGVGAARPPFTLVVASGRSGQQADVSILHNGSAQNGGLPLQQACRVLGTLCAGPADVSSEVPSGSG
jgi:threonyl-tRNA synthetase